MKNKITKKQAKIFIISDSIGETAQRMVNAVLAQFPTLTEVEVKVFPFISQEDELKSVLADALSERAIVATTLVDHQLNQVCCDFAHRTSLRWIDYMSSMLNYIAEDAGVDPVYESGSLHRLDQEYYDRVEAIEFAVKYDDGKDAKGLLKADLVLLGVSRTSKTPLSMYLANKAYRVANLPLIPEVPIPKEVFEVDSRKIIGLTTDPQHLMAIRQARLQSLGLTGESNYSKLERIKEEIKYSSDLFERLGAFVVNVRNKSIEEVAQTIDEEQKRLRSQN